MKNKKYITLSLIVLVCIVLIGLLSVLGINAYVKHVGGNLIVSSDRAANADCIVVLGCFVEEDGEPSTMLSDRLKRAVELYKAGAAPKIIMSGDHGRSAYDEVNAMKQYAIEHGVPSEDVFMDHAGFSTYETMYRAKEIFDADSIIVVTQEYHLYRAVYIADRLGMNTQGVSSDYRVYAGQVYRDVREILARCKDFAKVIVKPEPTFLGDVIPVSGNGDVTNDK